MNFDHDRQCFNTLIPPSHESAAVTVDCISHCNGPVRLSPCHTMADTIVEIGGTSETVGKGLRANYKAFLEFV